MSNYIVDGSELTSVANAIRAKSGSSSQLTFPDGFVSEIQSIQTGGGSSSHTVTISLGNPQNAAYFDSCYLRDGGEGGASLGMITSPTGSKTVTVTTGALYLEFWSAGGWVAFNKDNLLSASSGTAGLIGLSEYADDNMIASIMFAVAGDGSISLDFIDYLA